MDGSGSGNGPRSPDDDDVLREQSFKRPQGLNFGSFMVAPPSPSESDGEATDQTAEEPVQTDAAVGEINELFTMEVSQAPVPDSTTQMAVYGEQTIGKGLAVAMVVVWTAIGALVGTVLPPLLGGLGLLSMAAFGLFLGERWIRRDAMHLLGITWVIISMKLLYGLALDAWR